MENPKEQILDEELDNVIDKPWPIAFKYGVIGSLVFISLELIKYSLGMMDVERLTNPDASSTMVMMITGMILPPLSWVIYAALYFFAVKNHRDELGGFISFGKGFKVASFSVLVKAVLIFIWGMVYYFLIIPDYCQNMVDYMENLLPNGSNANSDMLSVYTMMYNPFSLAFIAVLWTIAGGMLLSLLTAAIGKKSKINS